jgi:hypothetical protein
MATPGQLFEIKVSEQVYSFTSTDAPEHVRAIEDLINDVIGQLRARGEGHQLTEYAMKLVILLADMAVRNKSSVNPEEVKGRFEPLLAELERLHIE